jgi:glycosyltransferase involved in cell wall biosynthesis
MCKIFIDSRMINHSGIGVYLQNILPDIIGSCKDFSFDLLGLKEILRNYTRNIVSCNSRIYSASEQLYFYKYTRCKKNIFWSPHFNIPILCKSTLLVTIHDCAHFAVPEICGNNFIKKSYINFMFQRIKAKAEHIITVSEFSKKEIIKYAGIKSEKITVIHNGVDESWFLDNVEKQQSIKYPYIICVGNVKPHKNIYRLLQAFDLIKDKIEHNLIIVGKKEGFITGDKRSINYVEKLKNRVKFTGFISDNELKILVNKADCLVFPSIYEGFGLPPLEAMAAGTPVCCSNISVLEEICDNTVEYFNPYDINSISYTILSLINNDKRKKELIEIGKIKARQYSWQNSAKKHIEIIKEIVNAS